MKKLAFIFTVLSMMFACGGFTFGLVYHIDSGKFPADPGFRTQALEFFNKTFAYVWTWYAEWKFDVPKKTVIASMSSLLDKTQSMIAKEKAENVDLLLLRALLKFCLYNVDTGNYQKEIIAELSYLKKKYPADYRSYWMLANYYIDASLPYESIREFDYLFKNVFHNNAVQEVVVDYTTATFFANMYSTSWNMIEKVMAINTVSNPEKVFFMYNDVKKKIAKPPRNTIIPKETVFTYLEREDGFGYLSRLFGIWIPANKDWDARISDTTKENAAVFTAFVPLKDKKGGKINASLAVFLKAIENKSLDDIVSSHLKTLKNPVPYKGWKGKWPSIVYEYRNPDDYKEMGGGHGMAVFVKRENPVAKGVAIERASYSPSNRNDGGIETHELVDGYTRFDGDIYYAFLLDSCGDIFEPSKAAFFEFMDKVLLD